MSAREYEDRFRPLAPSLHQTFAAMRVRNSERQRRRRILVIAAAVSALVITYGVASHQAIHAWTGSPVRTGLSHALTLLTASEEFRAFL